MKSFIDVVKTRKSVRSFSDKPVDRELIEKILSLAVYAPTNCNQQLWNFIVVEDGATKERLIKEAASNTLIRRTPVLIVVTYDGWNYKEAIQGASLAVGNILLSANYYDVAASPINSYGSDKEVKKILSIPESETTCCFVLLGHPDERAKSAPLVPRKNLEEVTHFGKYSGTKKLPYSYNPDDWTLEDLKNHQKHYCRKTFLGKEMDIVSSYERELVNRTLSQKIGDTIDLLSYDGTYLREFPDSTKITCIDLTKETSEYTKNSALFFPKEKKDSIEYKIYDPKENILDDKKYRIATMMYKLERVPDKMRTTMYKQIYDSLDKNGEFIIVARKFNLLLSIFYIVIKTLFGNDLRKTGIYNFFGPYVPINLNKTMSGLKNAGFRRVSFDGYFLIPTFYEQVYQMFLQYIHSGGSSYLHREKREDIISKFLGALMRIQGFKKCGRFGSVAVIRCGK